MINPQYSVIEIERRFFNYLNKKIGKFTIVENLEQMEGGFEAYLYGFKISGVEGYEAKLVLRLFPSYYHPETANWQAMLHNQLREEDLPVPKVYLSSSDRSILGGPFLIMEYVDGKAIDPREDPSILILTAKTQATLHLKDGRRIHQHIISQGFGMDSHTFDGRIKWLIENGKKYPGLDDIIKWLVDNRPAEPTNPKILHGDFHPMNLLIKDGKVSAILDWSGFMVGDPMYDLGWTKALFVAIIKPELSEEDYNRLLQLYIDAYQSINSIDYTALDYYVVHRLVRALLEGKEGQEIWTRSATVSNIIKEINYLTGITVKV